MATSYTTALELLQQASQEAKGANDGGQVEVVPLLDSIGRITASDIRSRLTTPEFDTSAMDGYAISSAATRSATPECPLIFRVKGAIAAGDEPKSWPSHPVDDCRIAGTCIEIMTGARFPEPGPGEEELDACVKMEDIRPVSSSTSHVRKGHTSLKPAKFIVVARPVPRCANRRFAGGDICEGDMVVRAGQTIYASQLMPLASVGIQSVAVQRRLKVQVFSTGKELLREHHEVANGVNQLDGRNKTHRANPQGSSIRDVNGIFLTAAFREVGANSQFLGQLADDAQDIAKAISNILSSTSPPDVITTSGGVSVGKFDHAEKRRSLASQEIQEQRQLALDFSRHPTKASFVPQSTNTQARKSQKNDVFQTGRVGTGEGGRIEVVESFWAPYGEKRLDEALVIPEASHGSLIFRLKLLQYFGGAEGKITGQHEPTDVGICSVSCQESGCWAGGLLPGIFSLIHEHLQAWLVVFIQCRKSIERLQILGSEHTGTLFRCSA
ncbi:hypothetical protein PspLS_00919, partial [Pyricularia sp. CBS 133598]